MNKILMTIALSIYALGAAEFAPRANEVIDFIDNHLLRQGPLKFESDFVYVELDDNYIHHLAPFLSDQGFIAPDYCEGDKVGAHITVIYPEEIKLFGIDSIAEINEPISFTIKECQIVYPRKSFESAYLIIVESPLLDEIREAYGVGKKEYAFHITVGVKPVAGLSQ